MKPTETSPSTPWQAYLNLGVLFGFWALLSGQLAYEWAYNGQYSYGLFVPFLALYLLHLRYEDRPESESTAKTLGSLILVFIAVGAVALYPFKIIFEANADWRLVIWLQALMAYALTVLLLWYWGGGAWVRHFGFPFFFILTAVPWPRWMEDQLVIHLMESVATATVETVNFLGIYAKQTGNIIMLKTGAVSVQEACSGVRSFQSTIMGAIFLGELLRFKIPTRIGLVVAGAACALFFNFCRTLTLTIISAKHGALVMERWHDPAGYMVFLLAIGTLGIICFFLHRVRPKRNQAHRPRDTVAFQARWLPLKPLAVILIVMVMSVPASNLWFAVRGPQSKQDLVWEVDWTAGTQNLEFEEIEPRIQDVLFYDRGELVTWNTPNRYQWIAYFFEWDSGKAAQLGGVHNPELCLPAVGWYMQDNAGEWIWDGPGGLELIFNSYYFVTKARQVYVFYCQWDPQGYPYHTKEGRFRLDRLHDAWIGDRKDGKQLIEIIIEGPTSMEDAQKSLKHFLDESIRVPSLEEKPAI